MTKFRSPFETARRALLAGLAASALAMAQGAAAQDAPMEDAPGGQQPGAEADVTQHQDWEVICPPGGAADPADCEMGQSIVMEETDQVVLRAALAFPPDLEGAAAIFVTPLGVSLPAGIRIEFSENEVVDIPYERCDQGGCRAEIVLGEDVIAAMRTGTEASIYFHDARRETVRVPLSLMGFVAAMDSLT